jgi:ankyrin repeat protein
MEAGQYEQYQAISKLYKEIVDSITMLELGQVKLYFVNLQKRIEAGGEAALGEYKNVKELLDSLKEAKGKVPIHFAAARGDVEVVRYLIEGLGLDHRVKDKEGNSPFFTAIEHGNIDLVRYFVEEVKCSPNESKEGEISTLHLAANHDHTEVLAYLIERGADVEKVSIYGKPINWSVGSGQLEATRLLLEKGASANGDSSGSSVAPLIIAIDTGNEDIYRLLLEKGADINVRDPNGYSVLHLAA